MEVWRELDYIRGRSDEVLMSYLHLTSIPDAVVTVVLQSKHTSLTLMAQEHESVISFT